MTRKEFADYYGISRKTFYNWLKKENIKLKRGYLTPKEQELIIEKFGKAICKK